MHDQRWKGIASYLCGLSVGYGIPKIAFIPTQTTIH